LNVPNAGLIDNLPAGCCVEVPVDVAQGPPRPVGVGALPPQCAVLCQRNVEVQGFVVRSIAEEDPRMVVNALLVDPLTGACLEPRGILGLAGALVDAEREFLPAWLARWRPERR
jgi:alpha-galactosidase